MTLTVGGLFSGIGGMELGLQQAGMEIRWHAETDPYCSAVLKRHWPAIPNHGDAYEIDFRSVEPVDVLAGGPPCQPVSSATRGRPRAPWLWGAFHRAIDVLRPRWVVFENVHGLLYPGRGFESVLRDLASCGYDAEWAVLYAGALGASHKRARVWLVGYPHLEGEPTLTLHAALEGLRESAGPLWDRRQAPPGGWRVDDGVPDGVVRSQVIGNAVVPACAELVGRRILETYK